MSNVHLVVGSIVVLLYLVNFGMYTINFVKGSPMPYHRLIAMGAAAFILLQYMLGFSLLGEGKSVPAMHVVLALLTILPVGAEHMLTAQEKGVRRRGMIGMMATLITFVLALIAYYIGQSNA
jgi:hypothetical protein